MHTYVHNTLLGIILGFSIGLGMYIIAPFTSAAGGGIYYTLFPKILSSAGTVKDSSELLGVGAAWYQRLIPNTCSGQWAVGVGGTSLSCGN